MYLFCRHLNSQSRHTNHAHGPKARMAARGAPRLRWLALSLVLLSSLSRAPLRAESNEATAIRAGFAVEYAVPNGPRNMAEEAPGRIWYTSTDAGGIGFLEVITDTQPISDTTPISDTEPLTNTNPLTDSVGSIIRYRTEFYGFGENSRPYDIVYDNGVVWFTLNGLRSLGRIDVVTREIKSYALLSYGALPTGLDVDPNGQLWIAQNNGRISRFDPVTETFTEFVMPDNLAQTPRVEDIVYQNERAIWFTMPDANRVVAYDSIRDRFLDTRVTEAQPLGITLDERGRLWVTAYGSSRLGRYSPTTVSIWLWYDTPTPDSGPTGVLAFDDAQGVTQLWTTENKTGTIGRLHLENSFTQVGQDIVGPNNPPGNTWGIIRSANGNIWVADAGRNLLYELTEPYVRKLYLATVASE